MNIVLDEGAKKPTRAHDTDAGLDLYSIEEKTIPPHESRSINTGVHVQLPKNTAGLLVAKSGLNIKHNIISTGLIDEGYTGEIIVKLYNLGDECFLVNKGDKISQLVIIPVLYEEVAPVSTLNETDRGNNGFGSTGRR
jgi:dUTP pyrophosphatase